LFDELHADLGRGEGSKGGAGVGRADELSVVISGSAAIEVEGGPTLRVGTGDMVVLRAGDRTTWTVHETLRKVYAVNL
jgi:uncharacterized cupin superfamily protein